MAVRLRSLVFAVSVLALAGSLSPGGLGCERHDLLECGSPPVPREIESGTKRIKVVSYNIRWRGGEDLRGIIDLLKADPEVGGAAIIGLQEVDRNKKRTGNKNTVRSIAGELGLHYAWAAPPPPRDSPESEEETGVAILSASPLKAVSRIVLPLAGPGGRRRVAVGATVFAGKAPVRVYSLHAETRLSGERRLEQFRAVLDDLKANHAGIDRTIIMGDFNTWQIGSGDKTRGLFEENGFHTPFNGQETWRQLIIRLTLDWVWLRGLQVADHGVDREARFSDHWPLWVDLALH
jgi:endonuclease/exonuclease/phosphatase family metal-dependent hydrolase